MTGPVSYHDRLRKIGRDHWRELLAYESEKRQRRPDNVRIESPDALVLTWEDGVGEYHETTFQLGRNALEELTLRVEAGRRWLDEAETKRAPPARRVGPRDASAWMLIGSIWGAVVWSMFGPCVHGCAWTPDAPQCADMWPEEAVELFPPGDAGVLEVLRRDSGVR